ncbi:ubiquitin carboxyl-terminal hydrolase isozyme L3-like [Argiope bruennichi]|uniref:Ubiquitin carboxyl-terminal hydrolase n=1 Tax=Argiope bruennichi TaxID=94029 RepID=A0A8T0EKS5_ARGBR|nr:ubiquitin carboxyl-terminal hydrolase isozyme L3-like [Argiope bruennichi]KAF8774560.1 Ubiquitin carboxyl-terminal hydrolase isozyme like protein [Argiope bruennichi]
MSSLEWLPVVSDPDVMNRFLEKVGVPKQWGISDIVSLDEELLNSVPKPVYAVLLLFPISEDDYEYCMEQEQIARYGHPELDRDIYFMHQTITNGCGVVALIHAIANNIEHLDLPSDSIIKRFIDETRRISPQYKAEVLKTKRDICLALKGSYEDGESFGTKCEYHYITLIHFNSKLYELDGRKLAPVVHGPTSNETFLKDAARVCKEYMERGPMVISRTNRRSRTFEPRNIRFTALAFGAVSM